VIKKIFSSIVLIFTLTACSMNDVVALLVTPTASPSPVVETVTPTVETTPSLTPTITVVPTFTSTPTRVGSGGGFGVPAGDSDAAPLPTLVLIPTSTPAPNISFFSEQGSIITSLSVSSDILFWGYCDAPKYVDFDVRLASTARVTNVLLFMRLVDKGGNQSTAWGGGAIMKEVGGGYFTYRVTPDNLAYHDEFKDAWIEYQVVVTTYGLEALGRSQVYRNSLSLKYCRPVEVDE
jgi:hypothetical protein